MLQYPLDKTASDPIYVTGGDLKRLEPLEFLNDNLVDLYFKVPAEPRCGVYPFGGLPPLPLPLPRPPLSSLHASSPCCR